MKTVALSFDIRQSNKSDVAVSISRFVERVIFNLIFLFLPGSFESNFVKLLLIVTRKLHSVTGVRPRTLLLILLRLHAIVMSCAIRRVSSNELV